MTPVTPPGSIRGCSPSSLPAMRPTPAVALTLWKAEETMW